MCLHLSSTGALTSVLVWSLACCAHACEVHASEGNFPLMNTLHADEAMPMQLVEVREGDSLEKIAARFGTTLRQTLGLNADIDSTTPLVRGQLVCLIPNSCSERV